MCVCLRVCTYAHRHTHWYTLDICIIHMYVFTYIYTYACIHLYIYRDTLCLVYVSMSVNATVLPQGDRIFANMAAVVDRAAKPVRPEGLSTSGSLVVSNRIPLFVAPK